MSREDDFATRMTNDATLAAILTGGVYKAGTVGLQGITRETASGAFSGGYLLPCALVRQRGRVPDGIVQEQIEQQASTRQIVEVWVYEDQSGYTNIDSALDRLFTLFYGYQFSDAFPLELTNEISRQRDEGALDGASLARQDWLVLGIQS